MNKKAKYTLNGAVGGAVTFAIFNCLDQYLDHKLLNKSFDWAQLFKASIKGSLIGGAVGFATGLLCDYLNSLEVPMDTSTELLNIVQKSRLTKTIRSMLEGREE